MTNIKLLGAYRVAVTDEELEFIAEVTGGEDEAREFVEQLALIEIEVKEAPADLDLTTWHQEESDQVPYDEVYFSLDGSEILARGFDKPDAPDYRVCFFLHCFDPDRLIFTPYGTLQPIALTEMPAALADVCHYEHPG